MSISCSKCGSRNTKIIPWKDLEKKLNKKQKIELLEYGKLQMNPAIIEGIIALLTAIATTIQEIYKNRNKNEDKKFVACADCGHTQEI